jgi:O-acetyl-ADP-ribose deacetylase (regulator of RNase III)
MSDASGTTRSMIEIARGNLLEADAQALVNTVNTVGVAGKGIALQFRQAFPENFRAYQRAARRGEVRPGEMFVVSTGRLTNPRFIINFPTKRHWRGPARMEDIERGLASLVRTIKEYDITSIAVPPLGAGNGRLDWRDVRPRIEQALGGLPSVRVLLFEPSGAPEPAAMPVATKRPRLTAVRAALLALFDRYGEPGYRLTMLEMQKLAYLLQEAGQPLRLRFVKGPYGPYAENLHHVLQPLEGHYIRGYGDRSREASVAVLDEGLNEAHEFLSDDPSTEGRVDKVAELIRGFETPYGLELLATTHWVVREDTRAATDEARAVRGVHDWSDRKKARFEARHVGTAWERLRDSGWLRNPRPIDQPR